MVESSQRVTLTILLLPSIWPLTMPVKFTSLASRNHLLLKLVSLVQLLSSTFWELMAKISVILLLLLNSQTIKNTPKLLMELLMTAVSKCLKTEFLVTTRTSRTVHAVTVRLHVLPQLSTTRLVWLTDLAGRRWATPTASTSCLPLCSKW